MSIPAFAKDPDSYLDYSQDWSAWLHPGDSIATSAWSIPTGLVAGTQTKTETTATIWIRGGNLDTSYSIVNYIVTAQGREDRRTILLVVQKR